MDRLLPWLRRSGWVYVAGALLLAVLAWRIGLGGDEAGGQPRPEAPMRIASSPSPRSPAARTVVHVAGEVRRPGVYRVREGERVADALRRAGGPTRRADLAALNLAA